ncbi:MAG TPA: CopG family transcriptional regulator [Desulfobacterales bacterium]|nr:CopG family transcriptional regulator [Desulfobacterales bacterium]
MGQVTIYLDAETEQKLNAIIGNEKLSKSRWIADLIRAKTATSWPESIVQLAGAWKDLPLAEEIREGNGSDFDREPL